MNFSVLDFFKYASRMPQTVQIFVSTFKIYHGSMHLDPPRYFLFFSLAIPGSGFEGATSSPSAFPAMLDLQSGE